MTFRRVEAGSEIQTLIKVKKIRKGALNAISRFNSIRYFFPAELPIPAKANVYYAINTKHDLNFVLREKSEDLSAVGGNVSKELGASAGVSASPLDVGTPKGGRRPPRDNSKARRKLLGLVL